MTIAGRGLAADRRQHPVRADSRRSGDDRPGRLLPRGRARRRAATRRQDGVAGVRPAVRRRPGRAQAPGAVPAAAPGRGDRRRGGNAPATGPPGPTRSSSTAARSRPRACGERIVEVVASWFEDDPGRGYAPRVLTNVSLDLAVAQGAAYYGVVRRGGGIRIGGGTARSFYVGLETATARKALALRGSARRPGGRRDRDRGPRLRPPDGPAGGLSAGEQLGPARRPSWRPGAGRSRLDPRAASPSEPDARGPQGQGRACRP